jgi:hypothetical protein
MTNIYSTPLSFGISARETPSSSVEIVSFLLLKKATVDNNIKCSEYNWEDDASAPPDSDSCDISESDSDDN